MSKNQSHTKRRHASNTRLVDSGSPAESEPIGAGAAVPIWVDEAIARFRAGASTASLVRAYGVTARRLRILFERRGTSIIAEKRRRKAAAIAMLQRGATFEEAVKQSGLRPSGLRDILSHSCGGTYPRLGSGQRQVANGSPPEWVEEAIRRYRTGESSSAVAASLNLDYCLVRHWLRKSGAVIRSRRGRNLTRPPDWLPDAQRRYRSGEGLAALAREYGVSCGQLRHCCNRSGFDVRKERRLRKEAAIEAYRKGLSLAEAIGSSGLKGGTFLQCLREARIEIRELGDEPKLPNLPEWAPEAFRRYRAGQTTAKLAAEYGVTPARLYAILTSQGVSLQGESRRRKQSAVEAYRRGGSLQDAVRQSGLRLASFLLILRKAGVELREEFGSCEALASERPRRRDALVIRMRRRGATLDEVADRLGCTREWVRQIELEIKLIYGPIPPDFVGLSYIAERTGLSDVQLRRLIRFDKIKGRRVRRKSRQLLIPHKQADEIVRLLNKRVTTVSAEDRADEATRRSAERVNGKRT